MTTAARAALLAVLGLVLTACGGADVADDGGGGGRSAASCGLYVEVDGVTWTAWPLGRPLDRPTTDVTVAAVLPPCDDVNPGERDLGDGTQVTLVGIEGVPPEQGLFAPGQDWDDQVFVPEPLPGSSDGLPAPVRRLIHHG